MLIVLIFVGGGLGSVCRFLLGGLVQRGAHLAFPTGTLAVNVLGCIAIGVFAKIFLHNQTDLLARTTLIVGFCGGFTTFSTFSYETVGLINGGEWGRAVSYVVASVAACLIGTAVGFAVAPTLTR